MYINKAFVYGNLTRDPEARTLPNGGQVCSFSIATNRVYKKADGNKAEEVEYHNITAFGRMAETMAQYLKKGRPVYVEGRLRTRSWEGDKGKQYRTEIVAESFQFGASGPSTGSLAGQAGQAGDLSRTESRDAEAPQRAPKEDAIDYPEEEINPEDIPF